MSIWPASRVDVVGFLPMTFGGISHVSRLNSGGGRRFNSHLGEAWARTASRPDGYSVGGSYALAIRAGGMSSWQPGPAFSGSASLTMGGLIDGTAAFSFTGSGDAGLITSLTGDGSASFSGSGDLATTASLAGDGAFSLSGDGALSIVLPMDGTGSATLAGSADLKGTLALIGSWSPFTELSPESLASAVWREVVDSGFTAAEVMRLLGAAMAGKVSGAAGTTVIFRDLGDTKDRIVATVDASGNRSAVTRDVT